MPNFNSSLHNHFTIKLRTPTIEKLFMIVTAYKYILPHYPRYEKDIPYLMRYWNSTATDYNSGRVATFEKDRGVRKRLSSTKPSALKAIIPIFKGPWKDLPPGHKQIDTVAHCGDTLLGDFAYSLSAIDAAFPQ